MRKKKLYMNKLKWRVAKPLRVSDKYDQIGHKSP